MADDFNKSNPLDEDFLDPNRPRLKKVKRPIKRMIDGQQGVAVPPKSSNNQFEANERINDDNFNLDALLDDDNLPVVRDAKEVSEDFQPQFIEEKDIRPEKISLKQRFLANDATTKKAVIISAAIAFVLGFFFAKIFFTEETVIRDGLQGVVINAEVPRGRARCGVAERTQGCVLYIMNPQRQEITARDFYDLASQLTGRQRFVIETGNMRYSNVKIRPGGIAQLNIPPLQ